MITSKKKATPANIVMRDITFSGPLSLTFANNPKSLEPVKALSPSDLPPCNKDSKITATDTINNKIFNIIFTSRRHSIVQLNFILVNKY